MLTLFSPNHVRLVQACYPTSSALLAAGPDYVPNSQELSRLTYYASNRPGKLAKLAHELEKRGKLDANRARSGNAKARASLLITLTIFKSLVTECRNDVALLSSALLSTLVAALSCFPRDLEVAAKSASLFTAWTTYTDGQLIGVDTDLTSAYMTTLRCFSILSRIAAEKGDGEIRNRQRLVGIAALTGVVTSDALYHSSSEFLSQVTIIIPGLLLTLHEADLDALKAEGEIIKQQPSVLSGYLSEFRPRPLAERRAASIHIHVDGDQGPSFSDVMNASLRAYQSLLARGNAHQVSDFLQAAFEDADKRHWWKDLEFCRWFIQTTTDWTQYQYRFSVPKKLVDRLVAVQDAPSPTPMHFAFASMIETVFTSPTPLVNLSTSDILSYLLVMLIRRITIDPMDGLLTPLVDCIAALGTHIYYQDQIHDLAEELIGRLVSVQVNGLLGRGRGGEQGRDRGLRCLLAALRGLLRAADKPMYATHSPRLAVRGSVKHAEKSPASPEQDILSDGEGGLGSGVLRAPSRRSRVSPEIWQDTLALLCEIGYGVRADYARALVRFIRVELPREPFALRVDSDVDGSGGQIGGKTNGIPTRRATPGVVVADATSRFLNAVQASVFALATSSSLGLGSSPTGSTHSSTHQISIPPALNVIAATPIGTPAASDKPEPSLSTELRKESPTPSGQSDQLQAQQPARTHHSSSRTRRLSSPLSLLDIGPNAGFTPLASPSDYSHLLHILTSVHEQLPGRALLTGIPMLLALHTASLQQSDGNDDYAKEKRRAIQELLARVWDVIGRVWECEEVSTAAQKALLNLGPTHMLPPLSPTPPELIHLPEEPLNWCQAPKCPNDEESGPFIDTDVIVQALAGNVNAQIITGLDGQSLLRRLAREWTLESALRDSVEHQSTYDTLRGGVSPFLKISPALMHIENLSLQNIVRTQYGVGVHDLREALEGRGSTPNLGLNSTRPSSIRTLDHSATLSLHSKEHAGLSRSVTHSRTIKGTSRDVRDVLNKLGVGKQNASSLLKSSFPTPQRADASKSRSSLLPPYST